MRSLAVGFSVLLGACGQPVPAVDGGVNIVDAGADAGFDAGQQIDRCPTAVAPTCTDQSTQQLELRAVVSDGLINEEGVTPGERTFVDARGGGISVPKSYTYARFTAQGLDKVELSDEQAANSQAWDIAFRRFIIRLNSGVSGPSCVVAGRTAPGTTFEGLTQVPANLAWRTEEYFTGTSCDLVSDTSGLGSPATALSSYWSYLGCVQTKGNLVFVLHLRDGRYVKFQVLSYYDPATQAECNRVGNVAPVGSGNMRVRWAFIDGPP